MTYPSVTEILHPYSGYEDIPEHILERASVRGTAVHALCADKAKGVWRPTPPPDCAGYVQSFDWWFDKFVDEVISVEDEFIDEDLGYMGHPDLIVRSKDLGGTILIDNKTPLIKRLVWGSQLSAYGRLALKTRVERIDRIGSLRLHPQGKPPKFSDYTDDDQRYFAAFYGALVAYNFFLGNKNEK